MSEKRDFEQIRKDIEARKKVTLWEDTRRGDEDTDAFLWKGDPEAKPIQRIGLILFACMFLLLSVYLISRGFQSHFKIGSAVALLVCIALTLIAARLIRNAFLHSRHSTHQPKHSN
jgi:uncharacterized membrane protein YcjF (UPF0283 family)